MSDTPTAVDGQPLPACFTFAQFLQLLEDGDLHGELSDALKQINAALNQHVLDYGGKPKGKLTVAIDFTLDGGVFDIRADYTVKTQKPPRHKTMAWSTDKNHFTGHNPKQMHMFGVRDVTPVDAEDDVRTV
ncbi:MAG: hypothetical protein QNJ84_11765 [Alphaproteobacteria bacterium]|nr:hypothetical protein [Alphaproteobacteria bacterium]